MAIQYLCDYIDGKNLPIEFVDALFNIYEKKSSNLHIKDQIGLIEAIVRCISTFNDESRMQKGLKKLMSIPYQQMQLLLNSNT